MPAAPVLHFLLTALSLVGLAAGVSGADEAETAADSPDTSTEEITITARRRVTPSSTMTVPREEFELIPMESGGQLLEAVPGLLTAQHTGGGKAEQYFLRGFDADHGTDLAVSYDGIPINLRSHAHGQGFIDLHFVIPEIIDEIEAFKGPYFANFGDFATAAAINYVPARSLSESRVKLEIGEFDTQRYVFAGSPRFGAFGGDDPRADAVLAFEAYHSDGPSRSPEDLWRFSFNGRGGFQIRDDLRLEASLVVYWADWNASGLIPERLVDTGRLDTFGSLDPSEGGDSRRTHGLLRLLWQPSSTERLAIEAWAASYDLTLYSNFTYYLRNDDPDVGDGILQGDQRIYTGGRVQYDRNLEMTVPIRLTLGADARYDDAEVLLAEQSTRVVHEVTNDDRVKEFSVAGYVEAETLPLDWLRLVAGLRWEYLGFDVEDRTGLNASGNRGDSLWLPKANLILTPFAAVGPLPLAEGGLSELEFFANVGRGYHSNDARAVVAEPDQTTLPAALGWEVGLRSQVFESLDIAVSYFWLRLGEEFVFAGDEGTTEPSGETVRQGVDLTTRWQIFEWLYLRGDVSYTDARFSEGRTPVPQAPRLVAKGALGVRWHGLVAEFNVKSLGDRDASEEDLALQLPGYTLLDLGIRYRYGPVELGFAVENLTDEDWRSSQFFYESRPIPGGQARGDRHFTPGNPRNVRGWIRLFF